MGGRMQTVTTHGQTYREPGPTEDCPECGASKTDLMGAEEIALDPCQHGERRFYECRACGCAWTSEPQISAEAEPIVIEGSEEVTT